MKQRWAWGISQDELTIAKLLKQAGYRTGLFGKCHLGYDFRFHPMNYGFDEFRGYVGGAVDCSDNGPQSRYFSAAGPFRGRKGSMYEGGHRVPFLASWQGAIAPGTTNAEKVMTMDFFPTFAKLAGVTPPEGHPLDGVDLISLLQGNTKKLPDRPLHWLFDRRSWRVIMESLAMRHPPGRRTPNV